MAYSGDPANSEIDAIRFWTQDTGTPELLSDAEIEYLIFFSGLDPEQSPLDIAALAADRIAAKYVGSVSISADGVSYSGDQLYQKYQALAKELRKSVGAIAGWAAGPFVGGLHVGRQFAVGMHDNPGAASQSVYPSTEDQLATLVDPDSGRVG